MQEHKCTMRVDYEMMRKTVDDNRTTMSVVALFMDNLVHQSIGVHTASDQIKHTVRSSGGEQVNIAEADVSTSAFQNGKIDNMQML